MQQMLSERRSSSSSNGHSIAMAVQPPTPHSHCQRVAHCDLSVVDWEWPFAAGEARQIAQFWAQRSAQNPRLFDGVVYLMRDYRLSDGGLAGALFKTDFKTFLYWRQHRVAATETVRECFGASLIRSAEGHVLLGRQGPGQLNSGLFYPPSGVIDAQDVRGGSIDIDGNVVRELAEETGLRGADLARVPGYLVGRVGLQIPIGIEWRSDLPADELRARILALVRADPDPELDDVVIVRSRAELEHPNVPAHARALVGTILDA
jgi:hypothetical protein